MTAPWHKVTVVQNQFPRGIRWRELRATGRVLKAGRRIIVTTADVVHVDDNGKVTDCAVMQQTLVPVPKTY